MARRSRKPPPVSNYHAVKAYRSPQTLGPISLSYEHEHERLYCVKDSIVQTIRFLRACQSPYPGGRLQRLDWRKDETVIWPFLKLNIDRFNSVEYYFAANQLLLKRTVFRVPGAAPQYGRFEEIRFEVLDARLHNEMMKSLENLRAKIRTHWPKPEEVIQPVHPSKTPAHLS